LPARPEYRNRPCTASGRRLACSRIDKNIFKLSNDPFFVEKVRDIVGLYLNPPENAVVLCVDEKSGIQALERTQPMLPLGLGYVEGVTHDYRRHGTTTLFAALDTANGKVLTKCRQRHRHQEYLSFLREIEKNVPKNLAVHIIVDNYATHKHLRVRRWFATRPRFHVHFTPTYASWLNQVEIWFNRITQQALRRGTFSSVKELVTKIDHYVKNSNRHAQPFESRTTMRTYLRDSTLVSGLALFSLTAIWAQNTISEDREECKFKTSQRDIRE
jgi:putative transposase